MYKDLFVKLTWKDTGEQIILNKTEIVKLKVILSSAIKRGRG